MIQPRKAIEKMKPYNPPLEARRGLLRLDFNENTIGCSPKVIETIRKISTDEIATYPEYNELSEKLASYLNVKKDNVIATNASDEAISIIMQAYIEKDDEIIITIEVAGH